MFKEADLFFTDPSQKLASVVENRRVGGGILGYALGSFGLTVFFSIGGATASGFITSYLFWFLVYLLAGYFISASAQLFLDLTVKKGSSSGMFALLGYVSSVHILLIAFALVGYALGWGFGAKFLVLLFCGAVKFLAYLALVSKAYKISPVMAFVSLVMSFLPVALLWVLFIVGLISLFV